MSIQNWTNKLLLRKQDNSPYARLADRLFAASIDVLLLMFLVTWTTEFVTGSFYDTEVDPVQAALALAAASHPEITDQKVLLDLAYQEHQDLFMLKLEIFMFQTALQFVLIGIYTVWMIWKKSATLGKMLVGIKVVDIVTNGKISFSQSLIRYIAYIPSTLPLMLGFFWGGFNPMRRCWHDYLADTVVVYDPNRWYKKYADRLKNWLFGSKNTGK